MPNITPRAPSKLRKETEEPLPRAENNSSLRFPHIGRYDKQLATSVLKRHRDILKGDNLGHHDNLNVERPLK